MTTNTSPTETSKAVHLEWTLHSDFDKRNDTRIDKADHAGATIFRLRTEQLNDGFLVVRDGKKVGTAASVGQARKIAERTQR